MINAGIELNYTGLYQLYVLMLIYESADDLSRYIGNILNDCRTRQLYVDKLFRQ